MEKVIIKKNLQSEKSKYYQKNKDSIFEIKGNHIARSQERTDNAYQISNTKQYAKDVGNNLNVKPFNDNKRNIRNGFNKIDGQYENKMNTNNNNVNRLRKDRVVQIK